jgi:hypothetical protein
MVRPMPKAVATDKTTRSSLNTPWTDEWYHNDDNFEIMDKEKRANGRIRKAQADAAVLMRNPDPAANNLGTKILECDCYNRCGSGADIQCGTAMRRWLVSEVAALAGRHSTTLMATVIPSPHLFAPDLTEFDATAFASSLRQKLADAGLGTIPTIGAMDISLNTYKGSKHRARWVPHWTLFFSTAIQPNFVCDYGASFIVPNSSKNRFTSDRLQRLL